MCLCAEVKRHEMYSAAHPMVNSQSRSGASEDQSCCEKGRQFHLHILVFNILVSCNRFFFNIAEFGCTCLEWGVPMSESCRWPNCLQCVFSLSRSANCGNGRALLGYGIALWPKSTHRFNQTSRTLTSTKTHRLTSISKHSNTLLSETSSTCEYPNCHTNVVDKLTHFESLLIQLWLVI